jgi:hypothetical protein
MDAAGVGSEEGKSMLTHHAQDRVVERFGVTAEQAEATLKKLWRSGHEAKDRDFIAFGALRLPNKEYRVSGDGQWMVVKSRTTGRWITVLPRKSL